MGRGGYQKVCYFFYYFAVQLHLLCVWEKVKFVLLHFDSSVFTFGLLHFGLLSYSYYKILIQDFIVLKYCIICIFLCHSDSVEKMSTVLFIQISLEYSENYRCFFILKMFWCLSAPPYCFFLRISEVKMSNFY